MPNLKSILKNKNIIKRTLAVAVILILVLSSAFENSFDGVVENVFAHARGQIQPDTNIVIINISSTDIDNLGHWPIKRSYYALLINSLTNYGVKKIGLEVFLSAKFVTQTLYDNLLTKEIEKSGRAVLSSVAGEVYYSNGKYFTDSLSYPSPKLLDPTFLTGHLNYFGENGIKIPLYLHSDNLIEKAFVLQLAGKNYNFPDGSKLNVNFISSWKKFKQFSMLQFFQLLNNGSDSLNMLKGKIVLIGISDPEIASVIETNYDTDLPGIALHAFALDNILKHRFLNDNLLLPSKILFILLAFALLFYQTKKFIDKTIKFYLIIFISFFAATFILFSFFNIQLAYSFFVLPLLAFLLSDVFFYLFEKKILLEGAIDESQILKSLLSAKEQELSKLQKGLNISESANSFKLIEKIKSLKADIDKLKENEDDKSAVEKVFNNEVQNFHGIIYRSKAMTNVVSLIKKAAPEDANILILGKSGTGKELVAKALHTLSKRKNNNFVAVNCGALSDTLLESELFGHVKGAFTGAINDKMGRFEAANNGTIFLDEIAETSENFQIKLLRVIQTGDYEKVGSSKTFHTNVRIVAATNKNLETAVREKKFREDLYYRLNVIKVELPPLRERKDDVEILARYFLEKETNGFLLSKAVSESLLKYEWKGNVRELEAVIKRAAIFARSAERNLIQLADLPDEIVKDSKFSFDDIVIESLRHKKFSHSSITETAKELGNVGRTVISENYRGYALKILVENDFDLQKASSIISASDDEDTAERVKTKLQTFVKNIETDVKNFAGKDFETVKNNLQSKYKNLPVKFHSYLDEVIRKYLL
ncbi:MAG: sigma 54-interacting transcriptional regulator [Ignavibacteriaceae bacterium]